MLFVYEFDFKDIEHVFLRGALIDRLRRGHQYKDEVFYCIWSVKELLDIGGHGIQIQLLVNTNMAASMVRECTRVLLQQWACELWLQVGSPKIAVNDIK